MSQELEISDERDRFTGVRTVSCSLQEAEGDTPKISISVEDLGYAGEDLPHQASFTLTFMWVGDEDIAPMFGLDPDAGESPAQENSLSAWLADGVPVDLGTMFVSRFEIDSVGTLMASVYCRASALREIAAAESAEYRLGLIEGSLSESVKRGILSVLQKVEGVVSIDEASEAAMEELERAQDESARADEAAISASLVPYQAAGAIFLLIALVILFKLT